MKFLIVLCFAICFITVNAGGMDPEMKKQMKDMMMEIGAECAKIEKASDDDIAALVAKTIPATKEGKCMMACFNENIGMQGKDGKMTMEGAMKSIEMVKGPAPEMHAKMVEVFKKCFPETESISERCDVAVKFAECGMAAAKEMGLDEIML